MTEPTSIPYNLLEKPAIHLPPATWRLIIDQAHPGPENMAIDEAILEAVGAGLVPPTLRLYAWDPPCLSLGYAQPVADVKVEALKSQGWDLVRRPTGGRAILHTDEITYSVIANEREPRVAGGVLESYQRLSMGLLKALHLLQTPAVSKETYKDNQHNLEPSEGRFNPVCFEVPSNWEITVAGKKLIGSAQSRRKGVVLQHGSLPLHGDLGRIITVLNLDGDSQDQENQRQEAVERLLMRACTLETALQGKRVPWQSAAEAIIQGLSQMLNLQFETGSLTKMEIEKSRELVETKYAAREWTFRL